MVSFIYKFELRKSDKSLNYRNHPKCNHPEPVKNSVQNRMIMKNDQRQLVFQMR